MINEQRLTDKFLEYVQIDSETRNEKMFADQMVKELKELGFEIFRDDSGDIIGSNASNIIAKRKGEKSGPSLALSAHLDTVTPGNGIKPVVKDGIISTISDTILGGDDKAGIAAIVEAIKVAIEKDLELGDLELLFTIAEEGGLNGSKNMDYSLVDSKYAYVFDSGGAPGTIMVQGPAQDKIDIVIKGRPAHAGVCPEEGLSAIQVAANAINSMNLLRIDEETTANVGIIKGGNATNIVCPEVIINAEARSLKNEKLAIQTDHMVKCFEESCKSFGAECNIEVERAYDAYLIEKDDKFLEYTRKVMETVGLEPKEVSSGGGSDTNIYNSKGIKALNLGIGMEKCHTLEEYIKVEDLVKTSKVVLNLITNFYNSNI